MKRRLPRKKDSIQSVYGTYAQLNANQIDPATGTTIPSEIGANGAKNLADDKEK